MLFSNKIRLKLTENRLDAGIIANSNIKNKIFKFILKIILLNDLYHVFYNDFIYMIFNDFVETNKYCF